MHRLPVKSKEIVTNFEARLEMGRIKSKIELSGRLNQKRWVQIHLSSSIRRHMAWKKKKTWMSYFYPKKNYWKASQSSQLSALLYTKIEINTMQLGWISTVKLNGQFSVVASLDICLVIVCIASSFTSVSYNNTIKSNTSHIQSSISTFFF